MLGRSDRDGTGAGVAWRAGGRRVISVGMGSSVRVVMEQDVKRRPLSPGRSGRTCFGLLDGGALDALHVALLEVVHAVEAKRRADLELVNDAANFAEGAA